MYYHKSPISYLIYLSAVHKYYLHKNFLDKDKVIKQICGETVLKHPYLCHSMQEIPLLQHQSLPELIWGGLTLLVGSVVCIHVDGR